jgi:hypothetical protein
MPMNRKHVAAWALAACLAAGAALAQTTLWVKSPEAELRQGAGLSGPVVAKVKQGTQLEVVKAERIRYLVRTAAGQEGWISRQKVTDVNPAKGAQPGGGLLREDRSAAEMSAATSGRGLRQTEQGGGLSSALETLNRPEPTPTPTPVANGTQPPANATPTPTPQPTPTPVDPAVVEAVRQMEALARSISEGDIDAFLKAGGLQ